MFFWKLRKHFDEYMRFLMHIDDDIDSYRGEFHIRNGKGISRTYDGFQGHLSTCASRKVINCVFDLPKTIILDEQPISSIWQSQFRGHQVTKEDIDLYYFAKDVNRFVTLLDIYFLYIKIGFIFSTE